MTESSNSCAARFPSNAGATPDPQPIDRLLRQGLDRGVFSGVSLLVSTPQKVLLERVAGVTHRGGEPLTAGTWFDLASLTKPLATVSLAMPAVSRGHLSLDDTLQRFFPSPMLPADKRDIRVAQLLDHSSGLHPHEPYYLELIATEPARRRDVLLRRLLATPLLAAPGKASYYSDLGFILLGWILEQVFDRPLDAAVRELLFDPAGISDLAYIPLETDLSPTEPPRRAVEPPAGCVATEICPWRERLLIAEVHNENAYCTRGVAGHAGLFGTARAVHAWLSLLWRIQRGEAVPGVAEAVPIAPDTVRHFWRKTGTVPDATWTLGFDTPSPVKSSAGRHFSPRSVGHLGYTGTSFWLDPDRGLMVVLLTNRVHPTRENTAIQQFRPQLHDAVVETFYG